MRRTASGVGLALLFLVLLPLALLWPSACAGHTFVPWDLAEAAPARLQLTAAELAAVREGANHDVTEVPIWFAPELRLARHALQAERALPAWNPWARNGTALHAHGLLGLAYPPTWIALLADAPETRLWLLCWISLALAGTLTFGFLRALDLSAGAALFGAVTFALSGTLAANAYFWMRLAALVWLPGLLWALTALARAEGRRRLGPGLGFASALAATWLAGFPPFATANTVLAAGFGLWLCIAARHRAGAAAAFRLFRAMAASALLGLCLAAPQLVPSLSFFADSSRPDPDLATIGASAFEAFGLSGYLLPDAISHPTASTELPYACSPLALWLHHTTDRSGRLALPNYNYTEYAVFAGTLGFLLAAYGALRGRGRLRGFALAAFAVLLGLALFVPPFRQAFALPVVRNVWPMRWLAPATLLVAWLGALGCERLCEARRTGLVLGAAALLLALAAVSLRAFCTVDPAAPAAAAPFERLGLPAALAQRYGLTEAEVRAHVNRGAPPGQDRFATAAARLGDSAGRLSLWAALAGVALVGATLLQRRRPGLRAAPVALAIFAAVELALHGSSLTAGRALRTDTWTSAHEFLAAERRAAAPAGGFAIARAGAIAKLPEQLPPGPLLAHGIRDLHFDSHFDARSAAPLVRLFGAEVAGRGNLSLCLSDDERLGHPLLDLLGVRYLLSTEPLRHGGERVHELTGPGGAFFIHARETALPRAFVVPALAVVADDAAMLDALADPALQPRAAALVTAAAAPSPVLPAGDPAASGRAVTFTRDHTTEVELAVGDGPAGWLVLADTFHGGWHADVDGTEVPIVRAFHSLRAVAVPAGPCRVRFCYAAPGMRLGLWLGAAGLLAVVVIVVVGLARTRTGAGAAP
jgi:hypothetical protein